MPVVEPPRPIGDMYSLVHQGIDAIGRGDEAALAQLARLTASVPRWIRLHLEMEHCVEPRTPVLMRDLTWRPAGSLRIGDEIIAFDEYSPAYNKPVKWRYSKVTGNNERLMSAWVVLLSDGTSLVTSGEHRWKTGAGDRGGGSSRGWVYTKHLRPGVSKLARYTRVWENNSSHDAGYLAGLFDGEGCIAKPAMRPTFAQRPGVVLEAALNKLVALGFDFSVWQASIGFGKGDTQEVGIKGGLAEYMRFLGSVRPLRLLENFTLPHRRLMTIDTPTVIDAKPIGVKSLSVLSTDAETFIAAGFGAHNTYPSPSGVTRCRLAQWYDARGMKPDQESPLGWKVRRAMGVLAEPYWLAVLAVEGAALELPNERYQCGPSMWAHPDAKMDDEFLVEFKSETGVGYKILLETAGGVEMAERAHYVQAQLYMHATGDEWTLYLTFPPDYGLLQSDMRRYKRYGQDYALPPVYLEWIRRDGPTVEMALERAETVVADKKSGEPPPKEHSGAEFKMNGKRAFPCGYCLHLAKCQRDALPDRAEEGEIAFV